MPRRDEVRFQRLASALRASPEREVWTPNSSCQQAQAPCRAPEGIQATGTGLSAVTLSGRSAKAAGEEAAAGEEEAAAGEAGEEAAEAAAGEEAAGARRC